MKETVLTIHNFGRHPRFWRHAISWIIGTGVMILIVIFINPEKIESVEELVYGTIIGSVMMIINFYSSLYFYERFYKKQKRFIFLLLHFPLFVVVASLGRLMAYGLGIAYTADIWTEAINSPIILLFLYGIKFIYNGIRDKMSLSTLKTIHTKTELSLLKTQLKPDFLINELKAIYTTNLTDVDQANEDILELADNLRERLGQTNFDLIPERFIEVSPLDTSIEKTRNIDFSRLLRHLIVWGACSFFILSNSWHASTKDWATWSDTLLLRLIGLWLYALLIYPSIYLYNHLVSKKKYFLYITTQLLFLFAITFILIIIQTQIAHIWGVGANNSFLKVLLACSIILPSAFGLKGIYHLIRESQALSFLKVKQTETQLKLLKSQINPHFLFNILNNIYAKNLDDSQKANEYIKGLTSLLRYQSESQQRQFIFLKEEVSIVENYINLEKIRLHNCEVITSKKGDFATLKIIPLLLLPLVENAFKYGSGLEKGEIYFYFKQDGNQFNFISNNKIMKANKQRRSTGIGLDNVQKRLNIIYPKKHIFKTEIIKNTFIVTLNITL